MKPSKLRRHLQQKHPEHMEKDLTFFQRQKLSLKRQKLDASGYFCQQSTASVQASFGVALLIAKHKKSNTIGETLIKSCALNMVKLILGETAQRKFSKCHYLTTQLRGAFHLCQQTSNSKLCMKSKFFPCFLYNSTNQ